MVVDGLRRDEQRIGHSSIRETAHQEPKHIPFTFREAACGLLSDRLRLPGSCKNRANDIAVQSSFDDLEGEGSASGIKRQSLAVGPRLQFRAVRVGDGEHASREWLERSLDRAVARPIQALVMQTGQRPEGPE
jgi:hypothetical protein